MRQAMTIRHEGTRVHLICNGRLVADLTPEAAREVAGALSYQAGRAEEIVRRELIVADQALMLRTGWPLGLIHDPHLKRQSIQEAVWGTLPRRYLPRNKIRQPAGGIRSEEMFGVPAIINRAPRRAASKGE